MTDNSYLEFYRCQGQVLVFERLIVTIFESGTCSFRYHSSAFVCFCSSPFERSVRITRAHFRCSSDLGPAHYWKAISCAAQSYPIEVKKAFSDAGRYSCQGLARLLLSWRALQRPSCDFQYRTWALEDSRICECTQCLHGAEVALTDSCSSVFFWVSSNRLSFLNELN